MKSCCLRDLRKGSTSWVPGNTKMIYSGQESFFFPLKSDFSFRVYSHTAGQSLSEEENLRANGRDLLSHIFDFLHLLIIIFVSKKIIVLLDEEQLYQKHHPNL